MGKFFNGQTRGSRTSLIRYIIIGCGIFFIILLFILIAAKSGKKDNVVLEPKKSITLEVNSDLPEVDDLFEKIENFDKNDIIVDYGILDVSSVGQYQIKVSAEKHGEAYIDVIVEDTIIPELILKDVEIEYGNYYSIDDFVASCTDNSGDECIIEYYETVDQNGKYVDFSSFTEVGEYVVKIIAKDYSDNPTPVKDAKLTIVGEGSVITPDPGTCLFGNMVVDKAIHNYPISIIVGDQSTGCALDRNIWDSATIDEEVQKFIEDDKDLLKDQSDVKEALEANFPNGAKIEMYPEKIVIFNKDIKGLVGFSIHVKVYMVPYNYDGIIDKNENLVLEYYIKTDHTREYLYNKFNIR